MPLKPSRFDRSAKQIRHGYIPYFEPGMIKGRSHLPVAVTALFRRIATFGSLETRESSPPPLPSPLEGEEGVGS